MNIGHILLSMIVLMVPTGERLSAEPGPPVRVIVYVDDTLLEKLNVPTEREEWLARVGSVCACRVEAVQPAPGDAWVLALPDRPAEEHVNEFLDCLRELEGVKDAERDQMLQPT